jgi:EF-hand domain-containing protein 1
VDADKATKHYMAVNFNIHHQSLPVPDDPYTNFRKTLEPGTCDTWGKFRSKKDESKIFNEAKLGNTVDNHGREGFMKYGTQKLNFRCVWDNTENLYGDVQEFSLIYYLSDDTLEINSIPSALTKEQNRLKLLKRSKLPRDFHSTMTLGQRAPTQAFFHWSDLYIGLELEVYARYLKVVDADAHTREFFLNQGLDLGPAILPPPPEVLIHHREVPPPTGFGSEEDSLRSVAGSLMPGPPPTKKYGENKTLSFLASLLSGTIDDKDRRFVISFYVADNTLKVVEPPMRNSGFTGGTFLSRRAIKKSNGDPLTYEDFYVGCKLRILMHQFLLLDTSEGTLRWMEDKGLPRSNFYAILDKIRPHVLSDAQSGFLTIAFQEQEKSEYGPGRVTKEGLKNVLTPYGLFGDSPEQLSEHELLTILRANGNQLPSFNYEKLIEQIINPTDEFK